MESRHRNPKLTAFQRYTAEKPQPAADKPMLNLVQPAQGNATPTAVPVTLPEAAAARATATDDVEDTQAYGFLRGIGDRALHLRLQPRRGHRPAPSYALLEDAVWLSPESGDGEAAARGDAMLLEYSTGLKVTIRGRNLAPFYERLLRHQVVRVTEMGEDSDRFLPEDATVVYAIEVVKPEGKD